MPSKGKKCKKEVEEDEYKLAWGLIENPNCPPEFFLKYLEKQSDWQKPIFLHNFLLAQRERVTHRDIEDIKRQLEELDGTLLSDLIGRFGKKDGIF